MTKKLLPAAVLAAVVVLTVVLVLIAPGSAVGQNAAALDEFTWEVVPGALFEAPLGSYNIAVGCRLTTTDADWGTRNSVVMLNLKLQPPMPDGRYGPGNEVYGSKALGHTRYCDLRKGIDTVVFPEVLKDAADLPWLGALDRLRVVVRYYNWDRHPPHTGLDLTNGQFHRFGGTGFMDSVNGGRASAAALAAEEAYELQFER